MCWVTEVRFSENSGCSASDGVHYDAFYKAGDGTVKSKDFYQEVKVSETSRPVG